MSEREPIGPPWSAHMSAATKALLKADQCFLLKQYDVGINHLGDVQQSINDLVGWLQKYEAVNK
jgi:hypothetical protein